jgi:hypothetical protein
MPSDQRLSARLETRFKVPFLGWSMEWSEPRYLAFSLTIAVTAALSVVVALTLPFLSVDGRELSAYQVGLLYDHLTGFDPLNFAQLIDSSRLAPSDILARWIYLPVLGLISFLLTLPSHFDVSVEEPSGRHAFAAGAALASLLYVILLLAYPVDNVLYGQCLCSDPWQGVVQATADLRWGFYLALLVSLYNIVANEILTGIEPFRKWIAPPKPDKSRKTSNQPQGDQPQGDQPQGDQPQGDQPQGDQPSAPQSNINISELNINQPNVVQPSTAPNTSKDVSPSETPDYPDTDQLDGSDRHDSKGHSSDSRWHFHWCRSQDKRLTKSDSPPTRAPIYPPAWPLKDLCEASDQSPASMFRTTGKQVAIHDESRDHGALNDGTDHPA